MVLHHPRMHPTPIPTPTPKKSLFCCLNSIQYIQLARETGTSIKATPSLIPGVGMGGDLHGITPNTHCKPQGLSRNATFAQFSGRNRKTKCCEPNQTCNYLLWTPADWLFNAKLNQTKKMSSLDSSRRCINWVGAGSHCNLGWGENCHHHHQGWGGQLTKQSTSALPPGWWLEATSENNRISTLKSSAWSQVYLEQGHHQGLWSSTTKSCQESLMKTMLSLPITPWTAYFWMSYSMTTIIKMMMGGFFTAVCYQSSHGGTWVCLLSVSLTQTQAQTQTQTPRQGQLRQDPHQTGWQWLVSFRICGEGWWVG